VFLFKEKVIMHMPLKGKIVIRRGRLSNAFGHNIRIDPKTKNPKDHQGWDIEAPPGTPVHAIKTGLIVDRVDSENNGYGKQICLSFDHQGTTLFAFYAHLSSIAVMDSEVVHEGQIIGYSGQTGNAKGQALSEAHLHFEIRTQPYAAHGLGGRLDPGTVLGFAPVVKIIVDEIFGNGIPGMK
jgi:murein DD-endopeptidase MepM/ murein hydrolase activator NlpD